MEIILISDLLKMFNEDGLSLKEIGDKVELSKSTVQRRFSAGGCKFNKVTGKYDCSEDSLSNPVQLTAQIQTSGKVQSAGKIEIVNRTYGISAEMDKALKIKCAIEGKNATDIVREALKSVIEEKYYNF